jgi:nitrogenase molybdenum-iron protein alpha/beta subunit
MGKDLSPPISFPYNHGVALAVNAISDAYMILDGPGCSFYRAMQIHGRHDWTSTMLSCDGDHRFQYAGIDANKLASRVAEMISGVISHVAQIEKCGAVIVTSLPMCTIAGTDHSSILKLAAQGKPAFAVHGTSLTGDWHDGFANALRTIAEEIDLPDAKKNKDNVAIIGHFMDRGEGDHRGNLSEFKRMLEALGLNLVSVWPSGGTLEELKEVRRAGVVVSLPHARRAGEILAGRLDAKLIETEIPFGLSASQAWIRRIGKAVNRMKRAETFIETELDRIVPLLEWAIPFTFMNKKVVFYGDPYHLAGMKDICNDLGMTLSWSFLMGRKPEGARDERAEFDLHLTHLRARWKELLKNKEADFIIGNTDCMSQLKPSLPWMEFGFPSVWRHCLKEEPFLGFNGFLALVDRMTHALLGRKAVSSWTSVTLDKSASVEPAAESATVK